MLIQYLNSQKAFRLSIDIPSGLNANEPVKDPEAIIYANHTLTFQSPKLSFFLPETGKYISYFESLAVGLDSEYLISIPPLARAISKTEAQFFYKQREKYAHKGVFGHSLLIGGSKGKMGAIVLATKAALRTGSGLATACIPGDGNVIMQTTVPEAMSLPNASPDFVSEINIDFKPSSIGIGPGLGKEKETVDAFEKLLSSTQPPMVIDADAINILSENTSLLKKIPKQSILTPHPGELKHLLGEWSNDFEKLEKIKKFSKSNELIVVIKGGNTITVFGDEMYINTNGNPGMATAGSGDVLTGMITGLLAQGYEPLISAIFGVYLHGSAGNIVSHEKGFEAMIASDIVEHIGAAFIELFRKEQPPEQAQEGQG